MITLVIPAEKVVDNGYGVEVPLTVDELNELWYNLGTVVLRASRSVEGRAEVQATDIIIGISGDDDSFIVGIGDDV